MSIEFHCPYCNLRLAAPEGHAGRQARCSGCQSLVMVPSDANPYASPLEPGPGGVAPDSERAVEDLRERALRRVKAPAIFLIVLCSLGALLSLMSFIMAFGDPNQFADPELPEFLREIEEGTTGPLAAALQAVFFGINITTIVCAVKMMQLRSHTAGLVASILAIINAGSCCCVLTIPIGIWSLVVLSDRDVRRAFDIERTHTTFPRAMG